MPLTDRARDELERRGPGNVRLLLTGRGTSHGQTSAVNLRPGTDDEPTRSDVEEWLAEKEFEEAQLAAKRHRQLLFWARIAGIAAIVAALFSIITIVLPLLLGAHLLNWLTNAPTLLWTALKQRL